jgi:NTE family protein
VAVKDRKSITLALQGGGAHGAFTWGVLDRLLEDGRLSIEGISSTSAGAMNAVVLADGLHSGGPDGAREALEAFWRAISDAARFSPLQRTPFDMLTGRWSLDGSPGYIALDLMSRLVSPYDLNPLDINPLRDLVVRTVDFDRVNACTQTRVFVTATHVRSGRARVFRQPDLSCAAVMASACLPFMYKAVDVDGEDYWDGGYMGNPALFPLVDDCLARDLVLVQVNPIVRDETPRSARGILNRLNEITFNASVLKDLRALVLLKQLIETGDLEHERYRNTLLHRIFAPELRSLDVSSKMNAEWAFLVHLRDAGRSAADAWLAASFDCLGHASTLDLAGLFEDCFHLIDGLPLEDPE